MFWSHLVSVGELEWQTYLKNKLMNHVRELNPCLGRHCTQWWQMILTCKPNISSIIQIKSNESLEEEIYPKALKLKHIKPKEPPLAFSSIQHLMASL
jgi:hypothetical protein